MNETLSTTAILKHCGYIVAGAVGIVTYIGLDTRALFVLGILMILDVVTGVIKSGTIRGWRSIKSMKLTSGVLAKLVTILVPIVVALAGLGIGANLVFVASSALTILILAETYSILGNIHSVTVGEEKPEFDAVGAILEMFRDVIENYFNKIKGK